MRAVPASRYVVFLLLAVVGCWADLATKSWAFHRLGPPPSPPLWLWTGYAGLETSLNEGALFGLGQGHVTLLAVLSGAAGLAILGWLFVGGAARDWLLTVALGCVTAGICGNLYDRLGMHELAWRYPQARVGEPVYAVRDWILLQAGPGGHRWPNFNLADSLLVCGAGLLLWHAFRPQSSEATQNRDRPVPDPPGEA